MANQNKINAAVADALEALHVAVGSCPGSDTITATVASLRGDTLVPATEPETAE